MKKIIIFLIIIIIDKGNSYGQHSLKFDSVKIYTVPYYDTDPHTNKNFVLVGGDSVLITGSKIAEYFFLKLNAMKKKSTVSNLRKIRTNYTSSNMNVKAVFIFFQGSKKTVIGVSPQLLMFINNDVYEKKDIKLEMIVNQSNQLYKNLFPSREEIIYKN